MTLEAKIIRQGHWPKIQIVSVAYGFNQRLQDGKWVNTTSEPQRIESEILTFGKCFSNDEEAEKFMNTKHFKSLFKNLQKNWV
jgi:hypothetical protein